MATTYTITSTEVTNKAYQTHQIVNGSGGAETETIIIDHVVSPSVGHYETHLLELTLKALSALAFDVWLNDGTNLFWLFEGTTNTSYEMIIPNGSLGAEQGNIQKLPILEGCTLEIRVVNVPNGESCTATVILSSYMSEEVIPCL